MAKELNQQRQILKAALQGKATAGQVMAELHQVQPFNLEKALRNFFDNQALQLAEIFPTSPLIKLA